MLRGRATHPWLEKLATIGLLTVAFALGGCTDGSRAKPGPACQPQCAGKSGGDDACGGVCPTQVNPVGCDHCGPNGTCVDNRCVCQPQCDGKHTGSDGCGGTCACPAGTTANPSGACVAPEACTDTCKSAGAECGDVCGKSCGTCSGAKTCEQGKCLCIPKCDGTRCDDGCGGTCACAPGSACAADGRCVAPADCHDTCSGAARTCGNVCGVGCGTCGADQGCSNGKCADLVTCVDCGLDLRVLTASPGKMTVAIDYAPDNGANPRLADIRFRSTKAIHLTQVIPGQALIAAGKQLYADPATGEPWRKRADGAYQMLLQSTTSADDLHAGRIVTFDVTYDGSDAVILWLVRRDQTFAPPGADDALQSTPYDSPVTVSR